ncbi:MAG: UTP--glucose-1-phosphate uridylyltransferase [Candidatus Spechtbacterales bacterium]
MPKVRKAIIPVAGYGTRFLPATKVQPKEMLPIVDKPVVHYLVEEAVESGIEEILFITNSNKHAIGDYFARDLNLENFLKERGKTELVDKIKHIHDLAHFMYVHQDDPLGSGDAILKGESFVGGEPFAIFYADDIISCPDRKPALGQLISVYENVGGFVMGLINVSSDDISKYGAIAGSKISERLYKVNDVVEKPPADSAPSTLASVGRFVASPDIFEYIKKLDKENGEVYFASALAELAKEGEVHGYEIEGDWYDCGNKFNFWKANFEMGLKNPEISEEANKYLKNFLKA